MAKSLLNAVNETMKKLGLIHGDSGVLSTLTDSARQVWIDQIVQAVNEGNDELYTSSGMELPKELLEGTLTLVTSDRDYDPATVFSSTDVNTIRWPLQDQTNGRFIYRYTPGYRHLVQTQQIPGNYSGLPQYGCIRETDGFIYLDRLPTATENGLAYTVWADKDIEMTAAANEVPYGDDVFRAMVPVWAQVWERRNRNKFDSGIFAASIGRASRLLRQLPPDDDYDPRGPRKIVFDQPPGLQ